MDFDDDPWMCHAELGATPEYARVLECLQRGLDERAAAAELLATPQYHSLVRCWRIRYATNWLAAEAATLSWVEAYLRFKL